MPYDDYILGVEDERQRCLDIVSEEPELEGEISDTMFRDIQFLSMNKKTAEDMFKLIIKITKDNIREKILTPYYNSE